MTVAVRPVGTDTHPVILCEDHVEQWDRFVSHAEGSTFCHLSGWREVLGDVLGHHCRYLAAVDGEGAWLGVLPLVRVQSRLLGHYLLSMPFLNDGGPLGTESARARLTWQAVDEAKRYGVGLMELRSRDAVPADLPTSHRKITVHLPLPDSKEELWEKTYRSKLRSQIRRPMKEEMETRFGLDQVEPFYEVFCRNMRDLGTPVLPRRFFERIARIFADRVLFGVVYHQSVPVAAGCGFRWREEYEITWASSLQEYNRMSPNMLLYHAFLERVIEDGVRCFNFGRCTPDWGTHRFKLQWGGHDVPLPWTQWSPTGVASTPSPDRPLFRMATAAWQRLPLPVANIVGPVLARRLP